MTQATLYLPRFFSANKLAVPARAVCPLAVLVFALVHVDATAQVTDFRLERVDNSAGGPALDGYVTNDLVIDFMGLYTGSQILLELEQGSIYQDPLGSDSPPSLELIELSPSVAFDTFVTLGSATSPGSYGHTNLVGGAINLGGERTISLETDRINAAWAPPGGAGIRDQTGFMTARITLSEDAQGTWRLLGSANNVISVIGPPDVAIHVEYVHFANSGVIRSGTLIFSEQVPEPATWGLALVLLFSLSLRPCFRCSAAPHMPKGDYVS